MDSVREVDFVLQRVRQATRRFSVPTDAAITQQVLLFDNSFYGYRFTTSGFTAVWSAAEQTLRVCNPNGQVLDVIPMAELRNAG